MIFQKQLVLPISSFAIFYNNKVDKFSRFLIEDSKKHFSDIVNNYWHNWCQHFDINFTQEPTDIRIIGNWKQPQEDIIKTMTLTSFKERLKCCQQLPVL